MFTGIIEELGRLRTIRRTGHSLELTLAARQVREDLRVGDSVAVNGVCLTVVRLGGDAFVADVMPETFARTALAQLVPGSAVNLERAMAAGGRFGGHIVQGHVDAVGTVAAIQAAEIARLLTVSAPPTVLRYVVPKGSITIDGVSLTVIEAGADWLRVGLIPHTAAVTTLGSRQVGDAVNLEADILGKYLEHFLAAHLGTAAPGPVAPAEGTPGAAPGAGGLTRGFLARHGYVNEAEA